MMNSLRVSLSYPSEIALRDKDCGGIRVQAGLWELRREWVEMR